MTYQLFYPLLLAFALYGAVLVAACYGCYRLGQLHANMMLADALSSAQRTLLENTVADMKKRLNRLRALLNDAETDDEKGGER